VGGTLKTPSKELTLISNQLKAAYINVIYFSYVKNSFVLVGLCGFFWRMVTDYGPGHPGSKRVPLTINHSSQWL
jgi:hypothetical protein